MSTTLPPDSSKSSAALWKTSALVCAVLGLFSLSTGRLSVEEIVWEHLLPRRNAGFEMSGEVADRPAREF